MLDGFLTLDSTEIINHARLDAYISEGLVPGYQQLEACGCPSLTPEALGQTYISPEVDPAPWYDAGVPESGEFAGFLMLSMTGQDERPTRRTVTNAITGGGVFSPSKVVPRTIVVSGVLLGTSCCGVSYGLKWLGQALDGCSTPNCEGADMGVYNCCPSEVQTPQTLATYQRTMRRVALLEGPNVTRRAGDGCRGGCTADVLFVEFILAAAEPWLWSPPVEVLDESVPTDDGSQCVDWTATEGFVTIQPSFAPCPPTSVAIPVTEDVCTEIAVEAQNLPLATCDDSTGCADPSCGVPASPELPNPVSCYCLPLVANQACYDLDTSELPANFEALPVIEVYAGSSDLRRLTITVHERTADMEGLTCTQASGLDDCHPHSTYHVGYLQAGSTLTLDGQVRRASVDCLGEEVRSKDVWGLDGAPLEWNPMGCGKEFCVCLSADAMFTPAADATVTIALSGRES